MRYDGLSVITAGQLRAARALASLDQRALANLAGLSLPTIQRMEASDGVVRGNVNSLTKLIGALEAAGIDLIAEGVASAGGGRGVRLRHAAVKAAQSTSAIVAAARAARDAHRPVSAMRRGPPRPERGGGVLAASPGRCGNRLRRIARAYGCSARGRAWPVDRGRIAGWVVLPIGLPWIGSHFRIDALSAFFLVVINLGAAAASLYGLGHSRQSKTSNAFCRSFRRSWRA